MKNKLDSNFVLIAFFIYFILFLIFLYVNFNKEMILEKREIYSSIIIGEKYGFDINGTALTFGMITPGSSSSTREISLVNNYDKNVSVEIYAEGDIKDFLKVSKNNFILRSNESVNVGFTVSVPSECEMGAYDGTVIILIKKVNS